MYSSSISLSEINNSSSLGRNIIIKCCNPAVVEACASVFNNSIQLALSLFWHVTPKSQATKVSDPVKLCTLCLFQLASVHRFNCDCTHTTFQTLTVTIWEKNVCPHPHKSNLSVIVVGVHHDETGNKFISPEAWHKLIDQDTQRASLHPLICSGWFWLLISPLIVLMIMNKTRDQSIPRSSQGQRFQITEAEQVCRKEWGRDGCGRGWRMKQNMKQSNGAHQCWFLWAAP